MLSIITTIFALDDTTKIAKALLGHQLIYQDKENLLSGYIVDVEAYVGIKDRASHSYGNKKTPRLKAMYDQAGSIYLYTMHTHLLLNLVTQKKGEPQGVMIRAIEPVKGKDIMEQRRKKTGVELTNGPGKVTQALGLSKTLYGQSIFSSALSLSEKKKEPKKIIAAPRIGIPNKGICTMKPLRFYVAGNPYVTKIKKSEIDKRNGWEKK